MKNLSIANHSLADTNTSEDGHNILKEVYLLPRKLLMQNHLTLAASETRQAGESLGKIIAFGHIAACLLFLAWTALLSLVALAIVEHSLITGAPVVTGGGERNHCSAANWVNSSAKSQAAVFCQHK